MAKRDIRTTLALDGETKLKDAIKNINKEYTLLRSEMNLVTSAFTRNDKSADKLRAVNEVLSKQIGVQGDKVSELENALNKAKKEYGENSNQAKEYEIQLNNAKATLTKLEVELKNNERAIEAQGKETEETTAEVKDYQKEAKKAEEETKNWGEALKTAGAFMGGALVASAKAAAAAVAAIGAGVIVAGKWINDSTKIYADFEDSMKQVQATMGLTGAEGEEAFKKLSDAAKEAGASTRFTASQSADALNYLALAGYSTEEAIAALPGVLSLAAAGDMDLAKASDLVTDSMAALGLEIDDMGPYMDKMAVTAQKSNTNIQQLGEGILVAGGTMKNAGQELDTLNAMLGVLANRGIKGSEGGTKLRNVVMSLTAPTDKAAIALSELGVSVADSDGNIRELNEILEDLDKGLDGLSETDKVNVLNTIFNKQDIAAVNALLAGTGNEMNNLYKELANSKDAAQQMADTMESGLAGSIRSLESAYEGLQIAVGEQFAKMKQAAVDATTELVRDITAILNDGFQEGDISEIGEKVSSYLMKGVNKISEYLPEVISTVTTMISELVGVIVDLLPKLLPALFDGALQLLEGLIDAIQSNVEPLMAMVVYLVVSFAKFLADNLPKVVEAGIELLLALIDGILEAIPDLIPAIVQAVMMITETLVENLPRIIEAAIKIIVALVEGLMEALPILIEYTPEIIRALIEALVGALPLLIEAAVEIIKALVKAFAEPENAKMLYQAGIEILGAIIAGLVGSIPQANEAMKEVVSAAVASATGFDWTSVGSNMMEGMKAGINSVASSVAEAAGSVATSALDAVKSRMKIKSPSQVFEDEVGLMMGLGIAGGLEDSKSQIQQAFDDVLPDFEKQYSAGFSMTAKTGSEIMHRHSGTLRVEGINDRGQLVGAVDLIMDRLRMEALLAGG